MLTGSLPWRAPAYAEQVRRIREDDPVLPRRIDSSIPGGLQNICLKALEKSPAARYSSARELAEDLDRFLAGEAVHASPASYSRHMSGKIEQHLHELEGWKQDQILNEWEYDSFRKLYDRLTEREDAWIMEARRLTLPQVTLYLGSWVLAVGAA
jgi:serine/threonine protein kinase